MDQFWLTKAEVEALTPHIRMKAMGFLNQPPIVQANLLHGPDGQKWYDSIIMWGRFEDWLDPYGHSYYDEDEGIKFSNLEERIAHMLSYVTPLRASYLGALPTENLEDRLYSDENSKDGALTLGQLKHVQRMMKGYRL